MLIRGGITIGKIIHNEEMVFGPGINRAYELESKYAIYPRIIFDQIHFKGDSFYPTRSILRQVEITEDDDGLFFINYMRPTKAWYVSPGWMAAIQEIAEAMPNSGKLGEKRNWIARHYNPYAETFSLVDFIDRWNDYASDADANNFVLMDEVEIFAKAKAIRKLDAQR